MKLIMKGKDRYYEADVFNIEDLYEAVRDGAVLMSYTKETANRLYNEFIQNKDEDN